MAADLVRPAAVEQLVVLGEKAGVDVHREEGSDPVRVVEAALARAKREQFDVVIVDTSGRLQVDDALMAELVRIRDAARPDEMLLVADAMTGQNAVDIAKEFDAKVALTGVILTKFDSDTRGGAALSVKSITGKPIKFVGVGEKLDGLEPFHPERIASRILGMGDVVTLVEKAQATMEMGEAEELQEKLASETFTLEDMLDQYRRMRKMGSLQSLMEMIPGLKGIGDGGQDRRGRDEARGGDHPVHDADGAAELPHHRPAPQGARGAGKRDLGVRGQQVLEKVREDVSHDEEDVEELEIPGPGACRSSAAPASREETSGSEEDASERAHQAEEVRNQEEAVLPDRGHGFPHPAGRAGAGGDRPVPSHREAGEAGVRERGEGEGLDRPGRHPVEHGEAAPGPQAGQRVEAAWSRSVEKDLVEYIAKTLVDDPAGVVVNVIEGEKSTILELKVADGDIGKVIGKHGRIAKAVRTLLSAASTKAGKRVVLEILD